MKEGKEREGEAGPVPAPKWAVAIEYSMRVQCQLSDEWRVGKRKSNETELG